MITNWHLLFLYILDDFLLFEKCSKLKLSVKSKKSKVISVQWRKQELLFFFAANKSKSAFILPNCASVVILTDYPGTLLRKHKHFWRLCLEAKQKRNLLSRKGSLHLKKKKSVKMLPQGGRGSGRQNVTLFKVVFRIHFRPF